MKCLVLAMAAIVATVATLATPLVACSATMELGASESAVISDPEQPSHQRLLTKFELPELLRASDVELAVLVIGVASDTLPSEPVELSAFPVAAPWSSADVEWSSSWSEDGGDFDRTLHSPWTFDPQNPAALRFDATTVVRSWLEGSRDNEGLLVVPVCVGDQVLLFGPTASRDAEAVELVVWTCGAAPVDD